MPLKLSTVAAALAAASLVALPALAQSDVSDAARVRPTGSLIDSAAFRPPAPVTADLGVAGAEPPAAPREFRGAWVASVINMDWPSRPGLTSWEQQLELVQMLDRAVELNLNAVILQVRPAADALYASKYEPWSEYLTGRMGRPPEPYYDPLEFAVREAHARGLELHAWFNPFRARYADATSAPAATHVSRTHPELVHRYGKYLWMDPGEPAVQSRTLRVITDVVRRYDVDGVHIDDYFYPYRESDRRGRVIPFPDNASWRRYRRGGGRLARDDWRRQNVDGFVRRMYREVKQVKPWVKVGISPFGIWRPGYPAQVRGLDAYEELYADSRKWLANGWLDYLVPQLYWAVWQPAQSYPVLLEWWAEQNAQGRHLWAGNYTSRAAGLATPVWGTGELLDQIRLTRAQPGATGNVHFSMSALMPRPLSTSGAPDSTPAVTALGVGALPTMLGEQLRLGLYATPALVPASPWLSRARPAPPSATLHADSITGRHTVEIAPGDARAVSRWVVRARFGDRWALTLLPEPQRQFLVPPRNGTAAPDEILVTAVDRYGAESEPARAAFGAQRSAFSGKRRARKPRVRSRERE